MHKHNAQQHSVSHLPPRAARLPDLHDYFHSESRFFFCLPGVRMRVGLGLCALLGTLVGVHLQGRQGLAMQALPDGSLLYPLSAGSGDVALISAGLMGFGLNVAAVLLAGLWQRLAPLVWVAYGLNVAVLAAVVALVSLDSSLLDAAWLGDAWPLVGVLLAVAPLGVALVRGLWALLPPGGAAHRR